MAIDLSKVKKDLADDGALNGSASTDTEATTESKTYTKFSSTRQATRMFTSSGIRISFVNHQLITDNEAIIEYLRAEIKLGNRFISEVGEVTSEDLDPMVALRKQFYAEFQAEQEAKQAAIAAGKLPDMGKTEGASALNVAGSNTVAR